MTVAEYHARVGPDGILDVRLALGPERANDEVTVVVKRSQNLAQPKVSQQEYERIIRETAGSIDDPTFVRPPQGEFEHRDSPFP